MKDEEKAKMLEEMLVEKRVQDTAQEMEPQETSVPLEVVLKLIGRLEASHMLKSAPTPPGSWILESEVPVDELAGLLHEHLSKTGWRRVIDAMHRHNRRTSGRLWDLSRSADFTAALKDALAYWETESEDESSAADDWAREMWRQVRSLMHSQLTPVGLADWLLSPRALVKRLSARAKRARTETQIESAMSQAALHAARMVGTDAERDVALKRVERLRQNLGDQLEVFCEEHGLPLPQPYSREEAYCLHLLNAYFVALAEAEDAISQRGAALARRQISLEGERAEVRMDRRLLPSLLEGRREVNPLRESLLRERMRHRLALLVAGILGAVGGGLWGVVESISDVLITSLVRYAMVVAPALLVGLMTLMAQTLAYSGSLTLDLIAQFLVRALWNGALALGATILAYGCWLYYKNQHRERGK